MQVGATGGVGRNEPATSAIGEEKKCTRCLDIFKKIIKVECGHLYCEPCLNEWKVKSACPACMFSNEEINDIEQLFAPEFKDALLRQGEKIDAILVRLDFNSYLLANHRKAGALLNHLGVNVAFEERKERRGPFEELLFEAKAIAMESDKGEESEYYLTHLEKMKAYLQLHPESINESWAFEVTPLHEAACSNLKKMVELLLTFQPDTTKINRFKQTAEVRSRQMGFVPIADMIAAYNKTKASS